MGIVETTIVIVLAISLLVFVALFGSLPVFRKTPIGFFHRLIVVKIPNGIFKLDDLLTGGKTARSFRKTGDYLFNEAHPIVLIFFLSLLSVSEVLFIPAAWPLVSEAHHLTLVVLSALPDAFLYLCATTSSSITKSNHSAAMLAYPYDYALFHPGHHCRTCRFPKPARSKHCSLCKTCIQKQDHHCIWINNCVGRNNQIWFLALLVSTTLLLLYGGIIGYRLLNDILQERFVPSRLIRGSLTSKYWSTSMSWSKYFDSWLWVIGIQWRIGAVTMLAVMALPLSLGFFLYHVYLLWTGMTTNESSKWADWRDDIADGLVYRASLSSLQDRGSHPDSSIEPTGSPWPTRSSWWVVLTSNGEQPTLEKTSSIQQNGVVPHRGEPDWRWQRVHSISELENLYDLGFFDNVLDVWNRG